MTVPTAVGTVALADQVWDLLTGIGAVNVFRGVVDLPPYVADDSSTHPFWDLDSAGNVEGVHAYAVVFFGAGASRPNRLYAAPAGMSWGFQVTCVGADDVRALWCVDKTRGVLAGVRLTLANGKLSRPMTEPEGSGLRGFNDTSVTPNRYYMPLEFQLAI